MTTSDIAALLPQNLKPQVHSKTDQANANRLADSISIIQMMLTVGRGTVS
jgi:hypothetical protein